MTGGIRIKASRSFLKRYGAAGPPAGTSWSVRSAASTGGRTKVATLVAVGIGALSLVLPAVGLAGTNGQQVRFTFAYCSGVRPTRDLPVSISGDNQHNRFVTWRGISTPSGFFIPHWWWRGNIHVTYTQSGRTYSMNAFVPAQYDFSYAWQGNADLVNVSCIGTLQFATTRIKIGENTNTACINLESNLLGIDTEYRIYSGYYGVGQDGRVSASGYSLGPNGRDIPRIITNVIPDPVCNE